LLQVLEKKKIRLVVKRNAKFPVENSETSGNEERANGKVEGQN
jgi:hypothetical protein